MSFRLFIYYCALCGGWAALFGYLLGVGLLSSGNETKDKEKPTEAKQAKEGQAKEAARTAASKTEDEPVNPPLRAGVMGLFLGMLVALALSLVDSIWILGTNQPALIAGRVGVSVAIGSLGGFLGGFIGQVLLSATNSQIFFIFGWTLTGMLVGASIGAFEVLASLLKGGATDGPRKKLIKTLLGGTLGGVLGGTLALLVKMAAPLVTSKDEELLVSPTVMGFIAVGLCIGLLVGLAQILFKEAWIKVEAGFRAGREMLLSKETTTIGRAESCDIGLFGDAQVEKQHAAIIHADRGYFVEDTGTPSGTFVNDRRVQGRVPLKSGDLIRVGKCVLRFGEREKSADMAKVSG